MAWNPKLGQCKNLKGLILNNKHLSGGIPIELFNCSNLEWISLTSNELIVEITPEFGLLTKLAVLQLGNNSLTGEIPAELAKIVMTETLSEITLTDQNKFSFIKDGTPQPLLQLLLNDNVEIKKVVIKALQKPSSLPGNGLRIIKEGVIATIMHLAISTTHHQAKAE
ncbi:hypothetical protein RJT34_05046 [Clitoria ternatea]|uniref:Uncharacterized protein n=1 Tax=Clitoria ternatea TaxID=43366 RepID=A0AAN9K415_CLITE